MCKMLIYQVMIALRYLHANNCGHLDVKCENILISFLQPIPANNNQPTPNQGSRYRSDLPLVKLADFGYSRIIGEHSFRKTRVGTVRIRLFSVVVVVSIRSFSEIVLRTGNLSKQRRLQSFGGHVERWNRSVRRPVRHVAVRRKGRSSSRRNRSKSRSDVFASALARRLAGSDRSDLEQISRHSIRFANSRDGKNLSSPPSSSASRKFRKRFFMPGLPIIICIKVYAKLNDARNTISPRSNNNCPPRPTG